VTCEMHLIAHQPRPRLFGYPAGHSAPFRLPGDEALIDHTRCTQLAWEPVRFMAGLQALASEAAEHSWKSSRLRFCATWHGTRSPTRTRSGWLAASGQPDWTTMLDTPGEMAVRVADVGWEGCAEDARLIADLLGGGAHLESLVDAMDADVAARLRAI
jgi:hypothetical protein